MTPPNPPVDFATDWLVSRYDFIETVSVDQLNPDALPGSDIIQTSTGIQALFGRPTQSEDGIAESGTAGVTRRDVIVLATGLAFVPKTRDRINRSDGTQWLILGEVIVGGFGTLYTCPNCTEQR